jgi:hypothetical protein
MAEKDRGDSTHAEAFEKGRLGADPHIERDAFTLQGQGEGTAHREREAREELRATSLTASRDPDYGKPSSSSGSSSKSSSSKSASKSSASGSSSSS